MYSTDESRILVSQAKKILENPSLHINKESASPLKEIIQFADWSYYVQDNPILADQEYDALFSILKKIETQFPEIITKDSPTQRIAKGLTKSFQVVHHLVP
ncbi:MAG TPA: DNA ligase (NAD(+)) LigA, partial [Chitinophagaceae bacterium]|nr:DNA ligase (NAD(+)) LigA [Chitinophagaceae bacterium]